MKDRPQQTKVENAVRVLLESLNLDVNDPNLKETDKRIAKMFLNEMFKGVYEKPPEVKSFPKTGKGTFIYTKVPFSSTCAHHFQPIKGVVHIMVDYSDVEEVIGLSKFNRIVDHFCKRPTLQEDLTVAVNNYLSNILLTENVYTAIQATHHCVTDRGVCAAFSDTITEYSEGDEIFINKCSNKLRFNR